MLSEINNMLFNHEDSELPIDHVLILRTLNINRNTVPSIMLQQCAISQTMPFT